MLTTISPELALIDAAVRMLWWELLDAHRDERGLAGRQLLLTVAVVGVVVVGGYLLYRRLTKKDAPPPVPSTDPGNS